MRYCIADAVHEASYRFCIRKAESAEAAHRVARVRAAHVEIEAANSTCTARAEAPRAIVFDPVPVPTLFA